MLTLFITGFLYSKNSYDEMRADRDDWKHIAELERARAEAAVAAGQVVKEVMTSLRKELGE